MKVEKFFPRFSITNYTVVSCMLQVQKTAKVYSRLSEVLGLSDEATVLSVFMRKM